MPCCRRALIRNSPFPPTFLRRLGHSPQGLGTVEGTAWRGGHGTQESLPGLGEVSALPAPGALSPRWASLLATGPVAPAAWCPATPLATGGLREGGGSWPALAQAWEDPRPPSPLPARRMGRGVPRELLGCRLRGVGVLCRPCLGSVCAIWGVCLQGGFRAPAVCVAGSRVRGAPFCSGLGGDSIPAGQSRLAASSSVFLLSPPFCAGASPLPRAPSRSGGFSASLVVSPRSAPEQEVWPSCRAAAWAVCLLCPGTQGYPSQPAEGSPATGLETSSGDSPGPLGIFPGREHSVVGWGPSRVLPVTVLS